VSRTFTNSNSAHHGYAEAALYGWSSNHPTKTWNNDLAYIGQLENDANPTAANGNRVADNGVMMFKSGVLDLTIRNTSYLSNDPTTYSTDATLETDIYEILVKKEAEMQGTDYTSLHGMLNQGPAGIYDQATTTVGAPIDIDFRGVTPFECNVALSSFGIKILKKTKYFLRNGQTLTYQYRDPKNRSCYRRKLVDSTVAPTGLNGCNKPGWTRFIFIIFKAIPGITIGTAAGQTTESVTMGVTRKYMYKIRGIQEDRSYYAQR
jgi:hypothetical protein